MLDSDTEIKRSPSEARLVADVTEEDKRDFARLISSLPASVKGLTDGNLFPRSALGGLLLSEHGLDLASDPRLAPTAKAIDAFPEWLSVEDYVRFRASTVLCSHALRHELRIPHFGAFCAEMRLLCDQAALETSGEVATYIPQLARVDPEQFGVSLCSVDGQRFNYGDAKRYFCVQALAMPISYGLALEEALLEHGEDAGEEWVHKHVGRESSGLGFNARVLDNNGLPHNPLVNAGAIMCASLIKRTEPLPDRVEYIAEQWSELCGNIGRVGIANSTFLSERSTADRNFCLGYMMQEEKCFPPGTDLMTTEDFYFMMCALETTAEMMAVVAGTIANGGTNPLTGVRLFSELTTRNILSLMSACGMHEFSGEFIFRMGFPAKSGVGGGLLVVIPGVAGFCSFSPRLGKFGNSARGVRLCELLSDRFTFHQFDVVSSNDVGKVKFDALRNCEKSQFGEWTDLWWSAAHGELSSIQRLVARGADLNIADFDGRTALHLAAAEGHSEIVRFLLVNGAQRDLVDRYGDTPSASAKRHQHAECEKILNAEEDKSNFDASFASGSAIFRSLDISACGNISRKVIEELLKSQGFGDKTAVHLKALFQELKKSEVYSPETFNQLVAKYPVIANAARDDSIVKDFSKFSADIRSIYDTVLPDESGANADYIPSLAKADPDRFGISVCTINGQQADVGDTDQRFGMQSMTKVINYCIAQKEQGLEIVRQHVGVEPSGRLFNEIVLDENKLPHNPCINAGAMMVCSLIKPEMRTADRFSHIESVWEELVGKPLSFNNSMYLGERDTADRNFCLGYYMKGAGSFPAWIKTSDDLVAVLELYFMTCSLEINTHEMSIVAATLANGGKHPLSGKQIFDHVVVRNALSIMSGCGMYDGSGDFAFRVGIPCKSGVGGGLMIVAPGKMGIATFSPRLDDCGNSVRGIRTCAELVKRFNFHVYDTVVRGKFDPTMSRGSTALRNSIDLLHAASTNDCVQISTLVTAHGADVNGGDYDDRTALHLAAECGHFRAAQMLIELGAKKNPKDRWGQTPAHCARSFPEILELLKMK